MHYGKVTATASAGRCRECPVSHLSICAAAGEQAFASFSSRARLAGFRAGETIVPQGEEAGHGGIIVEGAVKIVCITEAGAAYVLQVLQPGEWVGPVFPERPGVAWEAASDVMLCWIALPALETLMQMEPKLSRALLASVTRQLKAQWDWAVLLRSGGTLGRIASWLLREVEGAGAGQGNCSEGAVVVIDLRRRDLASLLDMTVETLCRGLSQLEQRQAIVMLTPKQAAVSNMGVLQQIANGERGAGEGKAAKRVLRSNNSHIVTQSPSAIGEAFFRGA
ncbi:Crp/Fnr family transcriptional regulator [Leisingera aquaemixtae]|uniref:Nitrogen fixation regulation protein FixK n=1 Tax=Leisingera aquaemixtae TaxID=1396826 RepID=A0A0P1HEU8_9RHOB|nr:Crp/Fnr family transcriptional regulator [Leisingera aquaemixtae]CUI02187.1 Nitrogen fixation regulation protein FixK [Leisingera aquaemixtae]